MSDLRIWAPPEPSSALHRSLRRAVRAMLPALLNGAETGANAPVLRDYDGASAGRLELRVQGSTMLKHGRRDAVKLSMAGHAGNPAELWAVGVTAVLDRATRAILALDLATEARRR